MPINILIYFFFFLHKKKRFVPAHFMNGSNNDLKAKYENNQEDFKSHLISSKRE